MPPQVCTLIEAFDTAKAFAVEVFPKKWADESCKAAPQLELDHLFSPTMALNHLLPESPIPIKSNGFPAQSPPESKQVTTPSIINRQRSPPIDRIGSPPHSEAESTFNSPHLPPNSTNTNGDASPVWSSAVGRATTGKSGRVIERLMNENDRLLREKKLATVRLEEEMKRGDSARLALESLQISNGNMSSVHEADMALLLKRDRKIQELKEELKAERARREKAEADARDTKRERDETVDSVRRVAIKDQEVAKRASSQYEVLSRSWKTLEERYERQVQQMKSAITTIQAELQRDREKAARLEVIIEQLRREEEKARKAKDHLISEFDAYKLESEQTLERIRGTARENESANDEFQLQLHTVLGEMKHVIGVQKAFERS